MQLLDLPELASIEQLIPHLPGIKRGIEKESLRVQADGSLSQKPHPYALGATLTHPYITTDYSEALPELITEATADRLRPLQELTEIHQFVYQNLQDELLWPTSMPCVMGEEKDIPIARYGSSNSARMKEVYRIGLGNRYGRFMQTIAGVHYNFSLPEPFWRALHQQENSTLDLQTFISDKYMALIRNYLRFSWVIPLFYGASPAVCESFLKNKNVDLEELLPGTRYGKFATSLRMSDLGYQNKVQSHLDVSYNSLNEYIAGLESAIATADPLYSAIGVCRDGEYLQLNDNILQIENEFYSSIRPKRVSHSGERPSKALRNRGIEYIEVRALDINPFSPIGVEQNQIAFLDSFLLACLFANSLPITQRESGEYQENFRSVVRKGRNPDLCLTVKNRCEPLVEVAQSLLTQIKPFALFLDKAYQTEDHAMVIDRLFGNTQNLDSTFSGRVVSDIATQGGFFPYALNLSKKHGEYFKAHPLDSHLLSKYNQIAADSHAKKQAIEEQDSISFEEFLANYYR